MACFTRWLVPLLLMVYSVYLVAPECPSSNPVGRVYCQTIEAIHPFWSTKVSPAVAKWDAQYGASEYLIPYIEAATTHWETLDTLYGISKAYKAHKLSLLAHISTSWAYLETNVFPQTSRWVHEKTYDGCVWFQAAVNYVEFHVYAGFLWTRYHVNQFRLRTVQPAIHRGYVWFCTHPRVQAAETYLRSIPAIARILRFLGKVVEKSSHINLHERTEFLKIELKNLIKSTESLKGFRRVPLPDDNIVEVVKDILEDVSVNSFASDALSLGSLVHTKVSAVLESATAKAVEKAVENAESAAQKAAEKTEIVQKAAEEALRALEYVENASQEAEAESSDEEPLTVHLTSTITVTQSGTTENEVATATAFTEVALEDTVASKIELELLYWETKVDKTLTLAYNNLEQEMGAYLNGVIDDLKKNLTSEFNALQLKTHQTYKDLNTHIGEINTEVEIMKSANQSYEKPSVSRELIRELIAEQRERPEKKIAELEKTLNLKNSAVLTKYFEVIQETIDILESFADTTILEFSNRLITLISILENEEGFTDELSWKAWRKFHKIKEEIFRIRDLIYTEANEYKEKLHKAKAVPKGLSSWADYLKTVNFHINHILIENDEYLQLVRARANVAFQFREGLVQEMEAANLATVEAEKQRVELEERVSGALEEQEADLKEEENVPLESEEEKKQPENIAEDVPMAQEEDVPKVQEEDVPKAQEEEEDVYEDEDDENEDEEEEERNSRE